MNFSAAIQDRRLGFNLKIQFTNKHPVHIWFISSVGMLMILHKTNIYFMERGFVIFYIYLLLKWIPCSTTYFGLCFATYQCCPHCYIEIVHTYLSCKIVFFVFSLQSLAAVNYFFFLNDGYKKLKRRNYVFLDKVQKFKELLRFIKSL